MSTRRWLLVAAVLWYLATMGLLAWDIATIDPTCRGLPAECASPTAVVSVYLWLLTSAVVAYFVFKPIFGPRTPGLRDRLRKLQRTLHRRRAR